MWKIGVSKVPVTPFSLKDAPALIERLLPVQKLSAEAYKEQMAVQGKTLTALGSYWKGRKPLILNKACILGCLLPVSKDPVRDLAIFEMLMGMDTASLELRLEKKNDKLSRFILNEQRSVGHHAPYREWVQASCRPEECGYELFSHIWEEVNTHLGTRAYSFPELVEQLGIMRFGHRPRMADTFCGSGQIPFESARLGCDVFASDLNPVACMLTWGAFNIIGGTSEAHINLKRQQRGLVEKVQAEIDRLGVETDGMGWRAKVFLYCAETRCPQTGWMVPLLPNLIVSKGFKTIAVLVPDSKDKRYDIIIRSEVNEKEFSEAKKGTVRTDGRGQDPYLIHTMGGIEYKTKISTLRGDYRKIDGGTANRLRLWDKDDFKASPNDIFRERLYCIQWMRPKKKGKGDKYEFRAVTSEDLNREYIVELFIAKHLADWQAKGWVPDMRIEPGDKTDEPIRTRGWSHWHHLFNPRQLLLAGLVNQYSDALLKLGFTQVLNTSAKLTRWSLGDGDGRSGGVKQVFDNQALNTLFNYGCRACCYSLSSMEIAYKLFPLGPGKKSVHNISATEMAINHDIYVTDPPYGDAVKYEEILEFFIAWLRKNPPPEFADWIWDSRRSLAIKGEGEDFRRGMVAAYKKMTECMPDNGIQVIMFTHQSGSIWADMANIVWASGLRVTAAWYVVTETESALREGSYVKGTVLLVCRKRLGNHKTSRDDLAWEIQEEVAAQVSALTGLNQEAKGLYRDENVFEDVDIQMAGYAAALRVLTRYAIIDGRDMTAEAIRPRIKSETTFVDSLIAFAVDTANQCLVPQGLPKTHWDKLSGVERFYLKMLDLEARGAKTLDNYQNFAKAFKVRDFKPLLASQKANNARLKSAVEFGRTEMGDTSELNQSVLRAVLYAVMELVNDMDGNDVLAHLTLNIPNYYGDLTQREMAIELADYLAKRLEESRPEEASAARVLRELVKSQRLG
jgi:putative DNA methylase